MDCDGAQILHLPPGSNLPCPQRLNPDDLRLEILTRSLHCHSIINELLRNTRNSMGGAMHSICTLHAGQSVGCSPLGSEREQRSEQGVIVNPPSRPYDNVILRRQPKNLENVSICSDQILRGVYPEPVEGLRMTMAGMKVIVGQPQ